MIAAALLILAIATVWAISTTPRPVRAKSGPDEPEGRSPLHMPGCGFAALIAFVLIFFGICLGPIAPGSRWSPESAAMQTTRSIALAMHGYAQDNNGTYPDGASSTEVFQKLLDGNYVSDPTIFYQPLPGKAPPVNGAKLKPENVGYDVTSGVDADSSDDLPIVFLTGFRIDYRAGASAVSLVRPFPKTDARLSDLFSYHGMQTCMFDGLPVAYKNNNAYFRGSYLAGHPTQYTPDGYGIVPSVVPPSFDAHGQTYRQLTPEGPLK
jgi:hypothetical protein